MNFTTLQTGGFADEDLVKDGWTDISQRIRDRRRSPPRPASSAPKACSQAYDDSDDEKMEEIRARVDEIVADPDTAEALKPWYRQLCKRPCFHDEYLEAYNNPNVHLVDTDGKGVERIDETGVWVGGEHYELDCLIYASGFEVGTALARRTGFDPVGRDGLTLSRALGRRHAQRCTASTSHGFPNLFIVGPTQGANLISNVPHNLTESGTTIATIIAHAEAIGAEEVEVTGEAEDDWVDDAARPAAAPSSATPTARPATTTTRASAIGRQAALGRRLPRRPRRLLPLHRGLARRPATSTASTSAETIGVRHRNVSAAKQLVPDPRRFRCR